MISDINSFEIITNKALIAIKKHSYCYQLYPMRLTQRIAGTHSVLAHEQTS